MKRLHIEILEQPDDLTCGPTCLHAVYSFYKDPITLDEVIKQVKTIEGGGTLGAILGIHALKRGYSVKLFTYNLYVFDPTWFSKDLPKVDLVKKLKEQIKYKNDTKFQLASHHYLRFIESGGEILFQDLTPKILRKYLENDIPILTGLSATYLYQCPRELPNTDFDDVLGEPTGHFVVLSGYDTKNKNVLVADPWEPAYKEFYGDKYYWVSLERAIASILLGVVTYDGNFLVIEKKPKSGKK